jgi:transcriptional regulator with XRE-family HTH domain
MSWKVNQKRKKEICERVKQIRVERFGEGRGQQKQMARELGIPYTTYRGYEENRVNDDFLRRFAKTFNVPFLWLMAAEAETGPAVTKPTPTTIIIDPERGVIDPGRYRVVEMKDDSMQPTLKKGSWVGIVPIKPGKEFQGKIIAIHHKEKNDIFVRRLVMHGRIIMAVADNPAFTKDTPVIHRSDVLGEVAWCWQKF